MHFDDILKGAPLVNFDEWQAVCKLCKACEKTPSREEGLASAWYETHWPDGEKAFLPPGWRVLSNADVACAHCLTHDPTARAWAEAASRAARYQCVDCGRVKVELPVRGWVDLSKI